MYYITLQSRSTESVPLFYSHVQISAILELFPNFNFNCPTYQGSYTIFNLVLDSMHILDQDSSTGAYLYPLLSLVEIIYVSIHIYKISCSRRNLYYTYFNKFINRNFLFPCSFYFYIIFCFSPYVYFTILKKWCAHQPILTRVYISSEINCISFVPLNSSGSATGS